MINIEIKKGSRIRAEWFSGKIGQASLAGIQLKTSAKLISITGTVRHLRTNDPNWAPENITLFVEPDEGDAGTFCDRCGVKEIEIKTCWVKEIL